MVISHNMQALNTNRIANANIELHGKSTEKVSSGYKINHVGDNPVGIAMSETMRRQVRGLNQGIENTKAAINLCQVADGALSEVSEMLQRINELAVNSENGTKTFSDRSDLQQEVDRLLEEIDHISDATSFNDIYMFKDKDTIIESVVDIVKPSTSGKFFQLFGDNISKTGYMQEELTPDDVTNATSLDYMKKQYEDKNHQPFVSVHLNMGILSDLKNLIGTTFFVNCCTNCCPTTVKFTDSTDITHTHIGKDHVLEIGLKKEDMSYYSDASEFCEYIVESLCLPQNDIPHVEFAYKDTYLFIFDVNNFEWTQDSKELAYFCDSKEIYAVTEIQGIDEKLWIQSGSEKGSGIWLEIDEMNTEVLGIDKLDITTIEGAADANTRVKEALRKLSISRSKIGAQQNRLEHTVSNEENISEQVSAAESRIRDTDLSSEMVRYSNLSILLQMGQTMIAQADQRIEKILTVLQ